ncbi:hypothetical protein K438DRAFT_1963926 [Mycena galopus ATCC 62051]|nr:hypothetical protein K438DRAFT_1963926 [Mycena galopus ATCC 62051]
MEKLGFSAPLLALFTLLPFVASQSSSPIGLGFNASTPGIGSCFTLCQQPDIILSNACPDATQLDSKVPCGCIDSWSVATQQCAQCTLPYSEAGSLSAATDDTQKIFNAFQSECKQAGVSIPNIDLSNIQLAISIFDPSFPDYITAICIEPSRIIVNPQCFLGDYNWIRCPNPDVAGILVRVSTYLANLLLGIVLMYSPAESATAVWTQLLTVYSLLVSGIIAIGSHSLSRFHTGMTVFLVMSPLSSSLLIYAVLGFCGRPHRLDTILSGRREHLIPRLLVIAYAVTGLAILIFTGTSNEDHFSPNPCESDGAYKTASAVLTNLLFIPYAGVALVMLLASVAASSGDDILAGIAFGAMIPFLLVWVSFLCGVILQRHQLAQEFRAQNKRWKIWVTWDVLAQQYPFMHFCGVFFVPMIYWVLVIELRLFGTPDNLFTLSFGQILAVFVILPPLWQVIQMAPKAGGWFMSLTVVRLVTGRPQASPLVRIYSLEDGVPEKDASTVSE